MFNKVLLNLTDSSSRLKCPLLMLKVWVEYIIVKIGKPFSCKFLKIGFVSKISRLVSPLSSSKFGEVL